VLYIKNVGREEKWQIGSWELSECRDCRKVRTTREMEVSIFVVLSSQQIVMVGIVVA
jgi:hypothetical protein